MPDSRPIAELLEEIRRLSVLHPLEARKSIVSLLDGEKRLLLGVLSAAQGKDLARVRSVVARAVIGHKLLPELRTTLEEWKREETDEFARVAIDDALSATPKDRRKLGRARLTNDFSELPRTYKFVSQRLRHRILNVLPRAGFDISQLRDAIASKREVGVMLAAVEDLHSTLRTLERTIDDIEQDGMFEEREVRLADWLRAFVAKFQDGTRLQVSVFEEETSAARVSANVYLLETVFRNLIVNSTQLVQPPRQVVLTLSASSETVHVLISDNGVGLTEEAAGSAFQLAYSSSLDPNKGRGHLEVADAMERMGGTATVVTTQDCSRRVSLSFPRR